MHNVARWCARPTAQPRSGTGPILAAPVVPSATATPAATGSAPSTKHAELPRRLMVTLLTTTFFYYPSLLTTSLSLFQCYHIDPTSQRPEQRYPQNAQVGRTCAEFQYKDHYSECHLKSCTVFALINAWRGHKLLSLSFASHHMYSYSFLQLVCWSVSSLQAVRSATFWSVFMHVPCCNACC